MRGRKIVLTITKELDQLEYCTTKTIITLCITEVIRLSIGLLFLFFEFRVQSKGNPRAHRARLT